MTTTTVTGFWCLASSMLLLTFAGCAEQDAHFNVKYAPDFAIGARKTISVFGVFKDGRMNADSWDEVGPKLSASLGGGKCEAGYNGVVSASPTLSSAVDDYARANGVTDDLLDQVAPMAQGDTVMLVVIAGHPPDPKTSAPSDSAGASMSPSTHGAGMRGGRKGMPTASTPVDHNVYEVTASLFDVRLRHSVAIVAMTYSGVSIEDALKRFSEKLGASLPGATCAGWKADVHVDDARIRKMSDP